MTGYLLIVMVLLVVPLLSLTVRRFPAYVFALLGLVLAWRSLDYSSVANLGGISLHPEDLICLTSLLALVGHGKALRRNLRGAIAPLLFVLLLVGALLVGYHNFGKSAANEARIMVWFVAPTAYFSSLNMVYWGRRLLSMMVALSWVLVVVALIDFAQHGLGSATSLSHDPVTGDFLSGRILDAEQSLVVGFGVLICFYRGRTRRPFAYLASGLVFLVVVALAQNRSVWIATGVGLVTLLVSAGPAFRRGALRSLFVLGIVIVAMIPTAAGRKVSAEFGQSVASATTQNSTLAWREQGWGILIRQSIDSGPITIALGKPFGGGFARVIAGNEVTLSPHNWFVLVYLKLGVVGTALVLYILLRSWRKGSLSGDIWLRRALLLTILSYCLAYDMEPTFAPIVAILLAGLPLADSAVTTPENSVGPGVAARTARHELALG